MNKQAKTKFTIDECYLMMFSEYEDIVTADEVASMLRLPEKRIYRMFRSGELKSFKDGRDVRTCKLWIIEYVQRYGFIRQESFRKQRKAAVTVFCQEPKSRKQIQEFLDLADSGFYGIGITVACGRRNTRDDQAGAARLCPSGICRGEATE